ncbi:CDP-archaeol synthase [Candidatus Shapirobacteria bacterium]|nr:CDP-archaeol synthase [Candidatus Shapirobacteria bacterium]
MELLRLIWWLAPAGVANMVPPLVAKVWPKWTAPIDGGLKWRGKRIFGDHKTIRGLVTGVVVGSVVFLIQKYWWKVVDYNNLPVYTGFLMASGALVGDCVKSFFKRQWGVKSGNSWFPWDQIDWILGFMLFLWPVYQTPLFEAIELIVLAVGLHVVVRAVGYWIKINDKLI